MTAIDYREIIHGSVEYDAMQSLRDEVLRKPLGLSLNASDIASEETQNLLGAFQGDVLIGCGILRIAGNGKGQIRQMAVAFDHRGYGVGKSLLRSLEIAAGEKGLRELYLFAREEVVEFYCRSGFQVKGATFVQLGILHQGMIKLLNKG